jgi:hypothetical protein
VFSHESEWTARSWLTELSNKSDDAVQRRAGDADPSLRLLCQILAQLGEEQRQVVEQEEIALYVDRFFDGMQRERARKRWERRGSRDHRAVVERTIHWRFRFIAKVPMRSEQ